MAAGKGKNRKAATENSASSSTCPTEESPRRWNTNKGESQRFPTDTADYPLPVITPIMFVSHPTRPQNPQ